MPLNDSSTVSNCETFFLCKFEGAAKQDKIKVLE